MPIRRRPAFRNAAHLERATDFPASAASRAKRSSATSSELAANAAIHSRSRLPGGTFTVRVKISPDGYAWVEVEDNGGPMTPGIHDATGHHGLDIVRALATDWSVGGDHTTRTIWARFDWPDCR